MKKALHTFNIMNFCLFFRAKLLRGVCALCNGALPKEQKNGLLFATTKETEANELVHFSQFPVKKEQQHVACHIILKDLQIPRKWQPWAH